MKNVRMAIRLMTAFLFIATGQGFGIEFNDGGIYNINYTVPDNVRVGYEASGMHTTFNMVDGGGIINPGTEYYWGNLEAYNDSRINISGGYIDRLDAYNSTAVNLSGGNISRLNAWNSTTVNILPGALTNGPFIIRDTTSVVISGGSFNGNLTAFGTSNITITGGNFRDDHNTYLVTCESSTVDISGGFVNILRPNDNSKLAVSGGAVGQLSALGNSTTTFYGYDFTGTGSVRIVDGVVLGTGELYGKWLDGTAWTTNINIHDSSATILAVPEPATLLLLGVGGIILRKHKH